MTVDAKPKTKKKNKKKKTDYANMKHYYFPE